MMSATEYDDDLVRLYRSAANERPPAQVDARILHAARQHAQRHRLQARWRLASMAAAAALLLFVVRDVLHESQREPANASGLPVGAAVAVMPSPATRYLLRVNVPVAGMSEVTRSLLNQDLHDDRSAVTEP